MTVVYALLVLAGFFALCGLMVRDIGRRCEKAQREVDLDELWGDDSGESAAGIAA